VARLHRQIIFNRSMLELLHGLVMLATGSDLIKLALWRCYLTWPRWNVYASRDAQQCGQFCCRVGFVLLNIRCSREPCQNSRRVDVLKLRGLSTRLHLALALLERLTNASIILLTQLIERTSRRRYSARLPNLTPKHSSARSCTAQTTPWTTQTPGPGSWSPLSSTP
jgi:hypothetical protein